MRYTLILEPTNAPHWMAPPDRRLARVLKSLLRAYCFRCVRVYEASELEAKADTQTPEQHSACECVIAPETRKAAQQVERKVEQVFACPTANRAPRRCAGVKELPVKFMGTLPWRGRHEGKPHIAPLA